MPPDLIMVPSPLWCLCAGLGERTQARLLSPNKFSSLNSLWEFPGNPESRVRSGHLYPDFSVLLLPWVPRTARLKKCSKPSLETPTEEKESLQREEEKEGAP